MKKKLTKRQATFLRQFVSIYQEQGQPVHYVTVAENLGLGNVTAYEMLRLLEERGFVAREYQSNPNVVKPGRSIVLFYPTRAAEDLILPAQVETNALRDWLVVKEWILHTLRDASEYQHEELLSNLLVRIQDVGSPLILVTELYTAMVLMLKTVKDKPEYQAVLKRLQQIELPPKINLSAVSGITMFLSSVERINRQYVNQLLAEINRYEEALSQLSEESQRQVGEFSREVVNILSS